MTTSDDSPQYGHRIMTLSVSSFIGRYVDHVKQVLPVNRSHLRNQSFRARAVQSMHYSMLDGLCEHHCHRPDPHSS